MRNFLHTHSPTHALVGALPLLMAWVMIMGCHFPVIGQTMISGKVVQQAGEPIPGANIYVEDTYDGSSTNEDGEFLFKTTLEGSRTLIVSFVGYREYRESVQLDGSPMHISVVLEESISRMDAVTITAGTFNADESGRSEVLQPLDIVTTAGATADISGALNALPGTQAVGEEGRLFVRGGDSYETTTFIDGMMVLNSYDSQIPNVPTRGRFSPMMFKGASFSTGGYSSEYGQALSSALILNTKDKATVDRTDFSVMSVGLEAATTKSFERTSIAGKVGYIDLEPYFYLVKQKIDYRRAPYAIDGNLALRHEISKDGLLKFYGKFNFSDLDVQFPSIRVLSGSVSTGLSNRYAYINSTYRDRISDRFDWFAGVSYTNSIDDIKIDSSAILARSEGAHFKLAGTHYPNENLSLHFGAEIISISHGQTYRDSQGQARLSFDESLLVGFSEADYYFSNRLLLRTGLRIEYNSRLRKHTMDPRVSMAYELNEFSQFSLAYGIFHQSGPLELLRVNGKVDNEQADHYIINYQHAKGRRTVRLEGYFKRYRQLISFSQGGYDPSTFSNDGVGDARGFDFFLRDGESLDNVDYWISYSYLDSERQYRDFPYEAVPTFASKHNFSFVYKQFLSAIRSQLGATYSFASGRPYNDPNEEDYNGSRVPPYHDLSLNVSFLWKPNVIVHASATNVLGRENVFGYEFADRPDDSGIFPGAPVRLPAKRFLFLGVFITLSKSGAINMLPNL